MNHDNIQLGNTSYFNHNNVVCYLLYLVIILTIVSGLDGERDLSSSNRLSNASWYVCARLVADGVIDVPES